MDSYSMLQNYFESFNENYEKALNGNKAAGVRARKALSEISKLCKILRVDIQNLKDK